MTSLEHTRLVDAMLDRDKVSKAREAMRDALLSGLSEVRTLTLGMGDRFRDKFLDEVGKYFHPDGNASDLFADAFTDTEQALDDLIEDREGELSHPQRVMAAE